MLTFIVLVIKLCYSLRHILVFKWLFNRERSEQRKWKIISTLGINDHRSAAVRMGGGGLNPLVDPSKHLFRTSLVKLVSGTP